jgi:ABC-2 type transport system permease protein
MDLRMDAGIDTFALNIPPDFQRDVLAGRSPTVQLNVDATRVSQAFTGSGYIQLIVSQEVQAFVQRNRAVATPAVDLAIRARFNPELNRSWFGAVMEVINQITMLSIVLTGTALIRERERGTIEHLLVMPVTPLEIMAGKIWAMGLVVLVACALSLLVVVKGLLAVPIEGSLVLFLCGTAIHLFATTAMGIFMGTVARSMPQFGLLLILVLVPMELLSGGSTPRESMPVWTQNMMLAAPTTHFTLFAQAVLYRGAGLSIVWPQFLAIAAIGAVFFSVALARFRKTIGTMV